MRVVYVHAVLDEFVLYKVNPYIHKHVCMYIHTVWWRYNAVNYIQNSCKRRTIARPLGLGNVCLLLIQSLIYVLRHVIAVMHTIYCYIGPRYKCGKCHFLR